MNTNFIRVCLACFCLIVFVGAGKAFAEHRPGHIAGIIAPANNDYELKNQDLVIRDNSNRIRIRLDAQSGDIRVFDEDGETTTLIEQEGRNMWLGGNGRAGDLILLPRGKTGQNLNNASVHIDGTSGTQILGGANTHGQLVLRDRQGKQNISLDAETADLIVGQEGSHGDIFVRNADGEQMISLDGSKGKIQGNQFISEHSSSLGSGGIDTASIYMESKNPAIGLLDNTAGNTEGWAIYAGSKGTLHFRSGNSNGLNDPLVVIEPEKVLIGTPTSPIPDAKLVVGGTIGAKEIIVTPSGWADDVFDPEYPMHSVDELETFLQKNRHLPGIPSEQSVMANGLSINEFNANILRNVEELTLRVIKHSNEIDVLHESKAREIGEITATYEARIAKFEQALVALKSVRED